MESNVKTMINNTTVNSEFEKKSRIRSYWDSKPNVGTIVNMRAVLK